MRVVHVCRLYAYLGYMRMLVICGKIRILKNHFCNFIDNYIQNASAVWKIINCISGRFFGKYGNDLLNILHEILNDHLASFDYNATKHIQSKRYPVKYIKNRCPRSLFLNSVIVTKLSLNAYQIKVCIAGTAYL